MKHYFLGIDIGTSSVKALAVDSSGHVITSHQINYPLLTSTDDHCEQDPEIVWTAFVDVVNEVIRSFGEQPAGICLSCAMHSLIVVGKDHQPITPSIVWADNRAAKIAARIRSSSLAEMLYEQSGTPIHAMSPLCKIIWYRENAPAIFQQAVKFISIKEFIWYKLFLTYEVDYSIASASGLMDIQQLCWNPNALSLANISEQQLSLLRRTDEIKKSKKVAGLSIAENIPVVIGASDGCFANLGSFAVKENIAALTIGTSGAVRVASTKPIFNFPAMTFNYLLDDKLFICGGPTNNGGGVLRWFSEAVLGKPILSTEDFAALLSSIDDVPPGSNGLIFLPYIFGERAPLWNSSASGVFFGMQAHHRQGDFTRAVVEGICLALFSIFQNMDQNVNGIHVSGGFVRSKEWLQIIADIFNKEIHLINTADASALGAAYFGMKSLEFIESYESLRSHNVQVVNPIGAHHDVYKNIFKKYQQLLTTLSPLMT